MTGSLFNSILWNVEPIDTCVTISQQVSRDVSSCVQLEHEPFAFEMEDVQSRCQIQREHMVEELHHRVDQQLETRSVESERFDW